MVCVISGVHTSAGGMAAPPAGLVTEVIRPTILKLVALTASVVKAKGGVADSSFSKTLTRTLIFEPMALGTSQLAPTIPLAAVLGLEPSGEPTFEKVEPSVA